jgi:hypothetical protein
MFNQYSKQLTEKYKEIQSFSDTIYKFVVANNQINLNEELINIYNKYDEDLRNLMGQLIQCEDLPKTKHSECINNFIANYDKLRSEISKTIEKNKL